MPEPPSAVYVACPTCDDEELHTVLKGEVGTRGDYTLDATVRCRTCDHIHHVTLREPGDREVPIIVSRGDESTRTRIPLPRDEHVETGDKLVVDGRQVLVTAVESQDGRRPPTAPVEDIQTLWAKDHESVTLKFSINRVQRTEPREMDVRPEMEVAVGDEMDLGGQRYRVHAIKVEGKMLRDEGKSAPAEDIVRVYARPPRRERSR